MFKEQFRTGVIPFDSTVALARRLRDAGIRTAIYSPSVNCRAVLHVAELDGLLRHPG